MCAVVFPTENVTSSKKNIVKANRMERTINNFTQFSVN